MKTRDKQQFIAKIICTLCVLCLLWPIIGYTERLKDVASVAGVRSNPLVGYGLVVGLLGTGDRTNFGKRSMRRMLSEFGINVSIDDIGDPDNVAVVAIHADLPPFAKPGQTIDVTVSSIGRARSLRGGSLLLTPLRGSDGKVYAVAQGNLVVPGLGAEGADGSRVTVNVPVVGRIPNGASIERPSPTPFLTKPNIVFNLHRADFTSAMRVAEQINKLLGSTFAKPLDATSISVQAPPKAADRVSFLSVLENIAIETGDAPARVIVNSRTGTIVIGQHVRVKTAAVTHGNLTVTITEDQAVSQPNPLAGGQTVTTPQTDIQINQENRRMFVFDTGVTLQELVRAVNQVGVAPGDLMAILEALKQAGALNAELLVI